MLELPPTEKKGKGGLQNHIKCVQSKKKEPGSNQEECVQRLQLAFGDGSPCRATVFRWFKEFCSGHNSLQDEEHTRRPRPAVIPDNVSAIRKMLMGDNRCTYQMIRKELNFGTAAIYKIIHE
ncbi:UNVERIFIED_CONTAM: hypothetical protein NCL1_25016 [Trichonephila clavipes]